MNFNTNEKINQVSENTLVIGIDIAKHKHFACAIDDRGRVLQKSFPIVQSHLGFEGFYERLMALRETHNKQEILVGFEPTGHYWMNLASVPGIGDVTIVDLLSEVGSLTQYAHPRQLIKLAGLTLRENSSGQQKGQKRISKRGRRKLRSLLFRVMMPLIQHNSAFKKLHEYYTTRIVNPLRKKQSIVVLCGKLLKILHALCKKKVMFNEHQMMRDFASLQMAA